MLSRDDLPEPSPPVLVASKPDRRLARRAAYKRPASFRESQRKAVQVDVVNLSAHGCTVHAAEQPRIDAPCWIILPTLESWSANIVWSNGRRFGLSFAKPLHRAVADMLLQRANGAQLLD